MFCTKVVGCVLWLRFYFATPYSTPTNIPHCYFTRTVWCHRGRHTHCTPDPPALPPSFPSVISNSRRRQKRWRLVASEDFTCLIPVLSRYYAVAGLDTKEGAAPTPRSTSAALSKRATPLEAPRQTYREIAESAKTEHSRIRVRKWTRDHSRRRKKFKPLRVETNNG